MNAPVTPPGPLGVIRLQVTGRTCASCALWVEKSLKAVPGVRAASVNLATEQASVDAATAVGAAVLAAFVRKAGYDVAGDDVTLQVEGMTCASCVSRVEKALLKLPGVLSATVNLATERASVRVLSTVPVAALKAALEKAGCGAKDVQNQAPPNRRRLPDWWPVALSAALTLPLVAPMLSAATGCSGPGSHWR